MIQCKYHVSDKSVLNILIYCNFVICDLVSDDFKISFILPISYSFQMLPPFPFSCLRKMLNKFFSEYFFCNFRVFICWWLRSV